MDYWIFLLTEAKSQNAIEAIIEKYGEQLERKVERDNRDPDMPVRLLLDKMMEVDPTKNSAYLNWIIREYLANRIRFVEDLNKVSPLLVRFEELKRVIDPSERDIMKMNFDQLWDFIQYKKDTETTTKNEKKRGIEQEFIDKGEVKILRNDKDVKIVIPKSERASCYYGRNTRWCTAATDSENMFDNYNNNGDLIIVLLKKYNERYQLHFNEDMFMDERDEPIPLDHLQEIFDLLPEEYINKNSDTVRILNGEMTPVERLKYYRNIIYHDDESRMLKYLLSDKYFTEIIVDLWQYMENDLYYYVSRAKDKDALVYIFDIQQDSRDILSLMNGIMDLVSNDQIEELLMNADEENAIVAVNYILHYNVEAREEGKEEIVFDPSDEFKRWYRGLAGHDWDEADQ